jgi:cell division protein FtsB
MALRLLTLSLAALLLLAQADLWLGKTSQPYVWGLQAQLDEQLAANDVARARNIRIAAEVSDLKEGLEMVEEKARSELGMIKPDEILVQVTVRR